MQPFNPLTDDFRNDPYAVYRTYRDHDPVHWSGEPLPSSSGIWYLFRHEDVDFVLKDARFVREYGNVFPDTTPPNSGEPEVVSDGADAPPATFWEMASRWMLFRDPPDHTRLRRLVNKAFTRRVVDGLAERIQAIAEMLLTPALADGGMDLIEQFAFPLPVIVIADMLGVPAEDQLKFKTWSNAMAATMDMFVTEEEAEKANDATAELHGYLSHIIALRRDDPRDDLMSALISAREQDDRLTEEELIAMAVLLLVAGHETTVNLIGNGALALMHHPSQLELLRADLSQMPQAVDELLRFDAPVQLTTRLAAEDVAIGGRIIRRGDEVATVIGAANRDPDVYENPDTLDVTRESIRHLSFGGGIHYCVGAPLARREGEIALTTFLTRVPSPRLVDDFPQYRPGFVFRGLKSLPIEFGG